MPAHAISTRPQTSHQARRAYQKAGPISRLSELQVRQLERSAELQERADRIKEREFRRKANLKKKNERIEREREARARMGIPSPVQEDVGASQMRLGAFLAIGSGLRRMSEGIQKQPKMEKCGETLVNEGPPPSAQRDMQARSPLRPRAGNVVTSNSSAMPSPHRLARKGLPIEQSIPNSDERRPVKPTTRLPNKVPVTASLKPDTSKSHPNTTIQPSRPAPMPPPPKPNTRSIPKPAHLPPPPPPTYIQTTKPALPRPSTPLPTAPPKRQPIIDEWAAFLVSNTQIEREICSPGTALPPSTTTPLPIPVTPSPLFTWSENGSEPASTPCPAPPAAESKAMKPKVSTKDLSAQICTRGQLDTAEEKSASPVIKISMGAGEDTIQEQEQSFSDDISDEDLEGAVAEAEQSTSATSGSDRSNMDQQKQSDSFCDDDFDLSTQELRDLID